MNALTDRIRLWTAPTIALVLLVFAIHRRDLFLGVFAGILLAMWLPFLRCPAQHASLEEQGTDEDGHALAKPRRCQRFRWHRGMHRITWKHSEQWIGPR